MIGVFDSGLGGLVVLRAIKKLLPKYDYLYFGDTLHLPYGNRSDEAIFELTKNAVEYLFSQNCKLIILACNTASAKALRKIQHEYLPTRIANKNGLIKENVLGVIRPMAEEMARLTAGRLGVIGTRATINSNVYVLELNKQNKKIKVFQKDCPLLVPLIEEGWLEKKEIKSILRYYLKPLKRKKIDTLILGCTHYQLITNEIKKIMGRGCLVSEPCEIVAKALKDYLGRHSEIQKQLAQNNKTIFQVTDINENFRKTATMFWGKKIKIKKVII